jgi:threonine aldolase
VICSSAQFIAKARRLRKGLGGGMRQAGIFAVSGLVALDEMVDRLKDDHANARRLAEGISEIDGLSVDLNHVKTNIVYAELTDDNKNPDEVVTAMGDRGVQFFAVGPARIRMVANRGVDGDGIEKAIKEFSSYFAST